MENKETFFRLQFLSGLLTESEYKGTLNENKYIDQALDHLSEIGDFNKLNELDKLILYSSSGNIDACKQLDLIKIYRVYNTFGQRQVKVQIKPIQEQKIQHKFSQEETGKTGFLSPYMDYDDEDKQPYCTITFDEPIQHYNTFGDKGFRKLPIMIENMYPIGYDDDQPQFAAHDEQKRREYEEFMKRLNPDKKDGDEFWGNI